ncbi:unnamed protein product [Pleuronectes platessa]|uniref:Uncharacterized protein n=1 Tax=Pleuronectes platessa TaxID=8262 RepID=A0A9N7Y0I7_PLEPL|nr:unnamed protein product [Pleuronectes platessa]
MQCGFLSVSAGSFPRMALPRLVCLGRGGTGRGTRTDEMPWEGRVQERKEEGKVSGKRPSEYNPKNMMPLNGTLKLSLSACKLAPGEKQGFGFDSIRLVSVAPVWHQRAV